MSGQEPPDPLRDTGQTPSGALTQQQQQQQQQGQSTMLSDLQQQSTVQGTAKETQATGLSLQENQQQIKESSSKLAANIELEQATTELYNIDIGLDDADNDQVMARSDEQQQQQQIQQTQPPQEMDVEEQTPQKVQLVDMLKDQFFKTYDPENIPTTQYNCDIQKMSRRISLARNRIHTGLNEDVSNFSAEEVRYTNSFDAYYSLQKESFIETLKAFCIQGGSKPTHEVSQVYGNFKISQLRDEFFLNNFIPNIVLNTTPIQRELMFLNWVNDLNNKVNLVEEVSNFVKEIVDTEFTFPKFYEYMQEVMSGGAYTLNMAIIHRIHMTNIYSREGDEYIRFYGREYTFDTSFHNIDISCNSEDRIAEWNLNTTKFEYGELDPEKLARKENSDYQQYYIAQQEETMKKNKLFELSQRDVGYSMDSYHLVKHQVITNSTMATLYGWLQNFVYFSFHHHLKIDKTPFKMANKETTESQKDEMLCYCAMLSIIAMRNEDESFVLDAQTSEQGEKYKKEYREYEEKMLAYSKEFEQYKTKLKNFNALKSISKFITLVQPTEPTKPEPPVKEGVSMVRLTPQQMKAKYDIAEEDTVFLAVKHFIGNDFLEPVMAIVVNIANVVQWITTAKDTQSLETSRLADVLRQKWRVQVEYTFQIAEIQSYNDVLEQFKHLSEQFKKKQMKPEEYVNTLIIPLTNMFLFIYWAYVVQENTQLSMEAKMKSDELLKQNKNIREVYWEVSRPPQQIQPTQVLSIIVEVVIAAVRAHRATTSVNIYTNQYRKNAKLDRPKIDIPEHKPVTEMKGLRIDPCRDSRILYKVRGQISDFIQNGPPENTYVHPAADILHFSKINVVKFQSFRDETGRKPSLLFSHNLKMQAITYQLNLNNINQVKQVILKDIKNELNNKDNPLHTYILDPQCVIPGMHLQVDIESLIPYRTKDPRADLRLAEGRTLIQERQVRQFIVIFQFRQRNFPFRLPIMGEMGLLQMCSMDIQGQPIPNLAPFSMVVDSDDSEYKTIRVMQARDLRTGAGYPYWVVTCSDSETCLRAFMNFMHRFISSAMAGSISLDVKFSLPKKEIDLPEYIQRLPVYQYEGIIHHSSYYAKEYVYNLVEFNDNPVRFWQQSTIVLGYIGTVTIFNYYYGIGIQQIAALPRFILTNAISKIFCQWYLLSSSFELVDPYCVTKILQREIKVWPLAEMAKVMKESEGVPSKTYMGQSIPFVATHLKYIIDTKGSMSQSTAIIAQDKLKSYQNTGNKFQDTQARVLKLVPTLRDVVYSTLQNKWIPVTRIIQQDILFNVAWAIFKMKALNYEDVESRRVELLYSDAYASLDEDNYPDYTLVTTLKQFIEFCEVPLTQVIKDRTFQLPPLMMVGVEWYQQRQAIRESIVYFEKWLFHECIETSIALGEVGSQYLLAPESKPLRYDIMSLLFASQYVKHPYNITNLNKALHRADLFYEKDLPTLPQVRKRGPVVDTRRPRQSMKTPLRQVNIPSVIENLGENVPQMTLTPVVQREIPTLAQIVQQMPNVETTQQQQQQFVPQSPFRGQVPQSPFRGQVPQSPMRGQVPQVQSWSTVSRNRRQGQPAQGTSTTGQMQQLQQQPSEIDKFTGSILSIPERFRNKSYVTFRDRTDYRDLPVFILKKVLGSLRYKVRTYPNNTVLRDKYEYCQYWHDRKLASSTQQQQTGNVAQPAKPINIEAMDIEAAPANLQPVGRVPTRSQTQRTLQQQEQRKKQTGNPFNPISEEEEGELQE